jgi:isopenicillin N synthase-like dioxygenase
MEIISDFKNKGYTEIKIPISKKEFEKTIKSYIEFEKNTHLNEKSKTNYIFDKKLRVSYGFRDKSDTEGFDNKTYFHFNPNIIKKDYLPNNKLYQKFINNINNIYINIEKVVANIILELDSKNHINKSDFLSIDNKPFLNIRIINYNPKAECETLAKKHTDRQILTLTLYETDDGLCFTHKQTKQNIRYQDNIGNLFTGEKWNEFSNKKLPALKHEVENTGYNKERSAVVVFINPKLD